MTEPYLPPMPSPLTPESYQEWLRSLTESQRQKWEIDTGRLIQIAKRLQLRREQRETQGREMQGRIMLARDYMKANPSLKIGADFGDTNDEPRAKPDKEVKDGDA